MSVSNYGKVLISSRSPHLIIPDIGRQGKPKAFCFLKKRQQFWDDFFLTQ